MALEVAAPRRPDALLETLKGQFAVFRGCLPLALGIHTSVRERMPDVDPGALRAALKNHTASTRYLKALQTGKERFDLDGQPVGEVTAEQREFASTTLRERFRKAAERRQADEAARRAAHAEQEAQQRRQGKLAELAARFNRR